MNVTKNWDPASHAAPGARFVTPDEYREGLPTWVFRGIGVPAILASALADAADEDGVLSDFEIVEFYSTHVRNALLEDEDNASFRLTYDRFTAFALEDYLGRLRRAGLLSSRGKGDSCDYRLTLPAEDTTPAGQDTVHLQPAAVPAVARAITDRLEHLANNRAKVEGLIEMAAADGFRQPGMDYQADLTRIDNDQKALREALARLPSTA